MKQMTKTEKNKPNQIVAFRKAARELECAENEAAFNAALKTVATAIGQDDPNAERFKGKPRKGSPSSKG